MLEPRTNQRCAHYQQFTGELGSTLLSSEFTRGVTRTISESASSTASMVLPLPSELLTNIASIRDGCSSDDCLSRESGCVFDRPSPGIGQSPASKLFEAFDLPAISQTSVHPSGAVCPPAIAAHLVERLDGSFDSDCSVLLSECAWPIVTIGVIVFVAVAVCLVLQKNYSTFL